MTPAREPPSYVGCAIGFAFAGSGIGFWSGAWAGGQLRPPGAVGLGDIYTWGFRGLLGGIVAGFALGLTYAFVRRPTEDREPAE